MVIEIIFIIAIVLLWFFLFPKFFSIGDKVIQWFTTNNDDKDKEIKNGQ